MVYYANYYINKKKQTITNKINKEVEEMAYITSQIRQRLAGKSNS